MKPIEYKEHYLVYPDGRIWMKRWNRFSKLSHDSDGYLRVRINDKIEKVHRVVASCFSSNPLNLPEVNHWNGIKTSNHILNLLWSTHTDNMKHSREVLGKKNDTPIRVTHILTGETYEFSSQHECSRVLDLADGNINHCLKGRYKQHKGYTFEYILT